MHPYALLEHIVKDVLVERCKTAPADSVRAFYAKQLSDPDATIRECKDLLGDWVLELSSAGKLRNYDE